MSKSIGRIKYLIEVREERIGEIAEEISDLKNGYVDPELDVHSDISRLVMERKRLQKEIYKFEDELNKEYDAREEREL